MSNKKSIILGNALSLVGALLFLTVFFVGQTQRALINSWGSSWVRTYFSPHQSQADNLLEEVRKGQIDQAAQLVQTKWQSIAKKDRVYPLKRKLLLAVAKELHRQGRYEELRHWVAQWQQLDERDIDAMAFWYEALYRSTDRTKEGFDGLKREWRHFPYNSTLTRFCYVALMEQGLNDDAQAIYQFITHKMKTLIDKTSQSWEVMLYSTAKFSSDSDYETYVDSRGDLASTWLLIDDYLNDKNLGQYPMQHGMTPIEQAEYWVHQGIQTKTAFGKLHARTEKQAKMAETRHPRIISTNDYWFGLVIDLDSKVTTLRVDLPTGLDVQIGAVRLRIGSTIQDISLDTIELNSMDRVDGFLRTAYNVDPYLSFSVSNFLDSGELRHNLVVELDAELVTEVGKIRLADFFASNEN